MVGSFTELQSRVIARGLCTACGTCAGVCPDQAVGWSIADGEPIPELAGECSGCGLCNSVCPGEAEKARRGLPAETAAAFRVAGAGLPPGG